MRDVVPRGLAAEGGRRDTGVPRLPASFSLCSSSFFWIRRICSSLSLCRLLSAGFSPLPSRSTHTLTFNSCATKRSTNSLFVPTVCSERARSSPINCVIDRVLNWLNSMSRREGAAGTRELTGLLGTDFFTATLVEGTTFAVSLFVTMGDTLGDISESSLIGLRNPLYTSRFKSPTVRTVWRDCPTQTGRPGGLEPSPLATSLLAYALIQPIADQVVVVGAVTGGLLQRLLRLIPHNSQIRPSSFAVSRSLWTQQYRRRTWTQTENHWKREFDPPISPMCMDPWEKQSGGIFSQSVGNKPEANRRADPSENPQQDTLMVHTGGMGGEKEEERNHSLNRDDFRSILTVSSSMLSHSFHCSDMSGTESAAEQRAKVALITGITGQDGSYLAELLLSKVESGGGADGVGLRGARNHPPFLLVQHGKNQPPVQGSPQQGREVLPALRRSDGFVESVRPDGEDPA